MLMLLSASGQVCVVFGDDDVVRVEVSSELLPSSAVLRIKSAHATYGRQELNDLLTIGGP